MQFITNGPNIPEALLQAHEEGRVVFFCGAGISYPAGLPDFKGLVERIYDLLGTTLWDIEREAFERGQFDAALDLLERRMPGERQAVRNKLNEALKPNLRRKGSTDTHAALLRLARNRQGALRLVTTNFDRVFHKAARRSGQNFHAYSAPMLPIPKNSHWNGLVYLHGLLPDDPTDEATGRIVLTSGDFGLAYLTERWASRFVGELFRNYVVCFVGYSINDPVLRYMMDALAADRMLGEATPQAWALGDCEPGNEHDKSVEWQAKGVTPVLYQLQDGRNKHSALHETLRAWAATYRDGVLGKEHIVASHALARPSASTRQDDFVGRMLWALSDKSGLPAKRFADFNPAPSLEWLLEAFSDDRFHHGDLARFSVPPHESSDAELRFSLVRRPAPYQLAPPMLLASGGSRDSLWDEVMHHIARWSTRHLGDPRLITWIARSGGQPHDRWRWLINHQLDRLASLEQEGNADEISKISTHAPNAIPGPMMRTLWRLLLGGRVRSSRRSTDLFHWKSQVEIEGLSVTRRLELRELLAPKVVLKEPYLSTLDTAGDGRPTRMTQLVDWELVLASDHVRRAFYGQAGGQIQSYLPSLLEEFEHLLCDALDLQRELGGADDMTDRSTWDLPSISPHWQNRFFNDWVSLIELLRDSWVGILDQDPSRAARIAKAWFDRPHLAFKRLALFAASQNGQISPELWTDWLLADDARLLWSTGSKRERLRLLVLRGAELRSEAQGRIEAAILSGPPQENDADNLASDLWHTTSATSTWLHLAKLQSSGLVLGEIASQALADLGSRHPDWHLSASQREEFPFWMSGTGDPDYEEGRDIEHAPLKWQELAEWLVKPTPKGRPRYEDTWPEVCRTRFTHGLFALCKLGREGVWPIERWREALQAWSGENLALRSWRYGAPVVQSMPDNVIQDALHAVSWWIEAASKSIDRHHDIIVNMCRRILALSTAEGAKPGSNVEAGEHPVAEAINHPIGLATRALINLWFARSPNDDESLPDDIKPLFTGLCNLQVNRYRHARVVLCSQLIALFRVDRPWTEAHLLPLFDWQDPTEAKGAWEGFLWTARLYPPLTAALKPELLAGASHYNAMGESRPQFAAYLTYAALDQAEADSAADFRSAFRELPHQGLEESVQALARALEGAASQSEDYWRNRVRPFWEKVWPKSGELATPRIAESLSRLAIAARDEFPSALSAVHDWLEPVEHLPYVVHLLDESGLCGRFPTETLRLLDAIVEDQEWPPRELAKCLRDIGLASPAIQQDTRFKRLEEYLRRRGEQ
ncbi:MAG: anti-phage defense-associated sirtuin Dsr1 [Dehalococcoidia bacterium]